MKKYTLKTLLMTGGFLILFFALPLTIILTQQKSTIRSNAAATCVNSSVDTLIIIDVSSSMTDTISGTGTTKIAGAKTAANNFVTILAQSTTNRISLVSFDATAGLNQTFTNNFSSIKSQITSLKTHEGTCHECAIKTANQEIAAHARSGIKKVIVLLTDGRANHVEGNANTVDASVAEQKALTAAISGHNASGTIFFTIGLGDDVYGDFLQQLASSTGGSYFFSPTTNDLNSIYSSISQIICTPENTPVPTSKPAPACGVSCSVPADCASAKDGCTACSGGKCAAAPTSKPAPACGNSCSVPADCASAKDGCTACSGGKCAAAPTSKPAPACGVSCSVPADCASAKDGCTACLGGKCAAAPTSKPAPACGNSCSVPADCASAKDGCTACSGGVCKPAPACGNSCSVPADCASAKDGCTACSGGKCAAAPTSKPAPACGNSCSVPADCASAKDGCTACSGGVCAIAATPVPTFDTASCTCDGMDNSEILSGQPVTINAYAKVIGANVNNARVVSQKFYLAEGAETIAKIIAKSEAVPANIIDNTASLVRYQSQWQVTLPTLKQGATYRLWSQIDCQPKQLAYNRLYTPATKPVVLGSTTKNQSILDIIMDFFLNLFNTAPNSGSQSNSSNQNGIIPTQTIPANTTIPATPTVYHEQQKNTLQLYTFHPATVYQKTCTFIKFKAGE